MIKALIFDWGDTVMRDYPKLKGPMFEWEHVELIPDVTDALEQLKHYYICCIASNAGASTTRLMCWALKRVHAVKYFLFYFTSKDLGYEKPDKRFFLKISERIRIKPEECIMIGNDYSKDIEGAKAAGLKTIFFNEKSQKGKYPHADKVIKSMTELIAAVQELDDKIL
jgi:putative hydrolase of the HAD superfamily